MATTTTDPLERIAVALELLNRRLKPVAELAERLNQEATGEDVKLVDGYVFGETKEGAPVLHLYCAHPKLRFRFCAVYPEKFDLLPFEIDADAKQWEAGIAPPDKPVAIRKGYFVAVPPFRAVRMPTGKLVDGKTQYKFVRALAAEETPAAPAAQEPPEAPPPEARPNGTGADHPPAPVRQPAPPVMQQTTAAGAQADRAAQQAAADRFKKEADALDIPNGKRAELLKAAGGDYVKALRELDEFIKQPLTPNDDAPDWLDTTYCDQGHEYPSNFFECPVCAEERIEAARMARDTKPQAAAPEPKDYAMLSPVERVMAEIEAEVARINTEPARRYQKAAQAPNVPFIAMENILKSLRAMK